MHPIGHSERCCCRQTSQVHICACQLHTQSCQLQCSRRCLLPVVKQRVSKSQWCMTLGCWCQLWELISSDQEGTRWRCQLYYRYIEIKAIYEQDTLIFRMHMNSILSLTYVGTMKVFDNLCALRQKGKCRVLPHICTVILKIAAYITGNYCNANEIGNKDYHHLTMSLTTTKLLLSFETTSIY